MRFRPRPLPRLPPRRYGFLFTSLLSSLAVFLYYDFRVPRVYAYWLLALYCGLMVAQGCAEAGVFSS